MTVLVAGGALASSARADEIRVQSTFDTVDAGLVEGLLRGAYLKAQPGDTLNYVANGTGAALTKARSGQADIVITHAPSLEAQFVADGFSVDGRAIFYSDYVIVGPKSDPAGVLTSAPHDAVAAFEKIAAAGEAGKATFVTRGDNSGTNVQEELMWGLTTTVTKVIAPPPTGPTDPARSRPGSSTASPPAWYRKTGAGQSQNLRDTDVCASASFPAGGCYTIVDRGTFNNEVNSGTVVGLATVSDKNAAAARGGENLLINPFSAYVVNPDKISTSPKPNVPAATRFIDFLTSQDFQQTLLGFPTAANPAFFPDAQPKITSAPPATAVKGSTVPLTLTATNLLPGGGVVAGLPVTLQQSVDGGASFSNVATQPTGADGTVRFAPSISATTTYRVSLPRFQQFSPGTFVLGVVAVPADLAPAPSPSPVPRAPAAPTPVPAADKTAPKVSRVKLTAKKLTLSITEAGSVRVTIARRTTKTVKSKRRTAYATVKSITVKATKSGSVSRTLSSLKSGTYRVKLRATDAAGNARTRTVTITIKAPKAKSQS